MLEKDALTLFYEQYKSSFALAEDATDFPDFFYKAFSSGDTTLSQKNLFESKVFDEEWITEIERFIPSLNKIVASHKTSLKYNREVVNIEKAKKVNAESVRHLAQNTHQIKEIKQSQVVPKKILTHQSEDDDGLYENRFVMTLIERLFMFIHARYELVKDNIDSYQRRYFDMKNTFHLEHTTVEMNVNLQMKDDAQTRALNVKNRKLFERIEYINKVINSLRNSQFMRTLSKYKKVQPPIIKTQILLKNIDYKNCYMLWTFLDRYNAAPFLVDNKEKNLQLDGEYKVDVQKLALAFFSTVVSNQEDRKQLYDSLEFKQTKKKEMKFDRSELDTADQKYQLETNAINEYFLEQNKKIFKKALENHKANTKSFETALKRTLRDTISITNALYASFFEIDGELAVYRLLADEGKDIDKLIKETKTKVQIARMIRETKEVDYNNAIRLEKKWLKQVESADQKLVKHTKAKVKKTKGDLKTLVKLENDKKRVRAQQLLNKKRLELVQAHKNELHQLRLENNKEIDALRKKLKQEEQRQITLLERQARTKLALEKKKHQEKLAKAKAALRVKFEKEKQQEALRLKKAKEQAKLNHQVSLKKQKESIKSNLDKKLNDLKDHD